MTKLIQGSGGGGKGGGGGSARTAVEAPNNLKSIQYAQIIDVISEGEIGGLVNGASSIFLDDVPLTEFSDATWELRVGTQTQSITNIGASGTKSTVEVGTLVRKVLEDGTTDGRVTKVIDATYFDAGLGSVDVTIGIPVLTYQDMSNGDINGTSVEFQISIATNSGVYTVVHTPTISGKCTSMYNASYNVPVSQYTRSQYPLSIRVARITSDSTKSALQNALYWSSYTLNYPVKLNYPNTALATLSVDSDHFSSIPTRAYEIYGIKVKVPSNYTPSTRQYAGTWDGTFKVAWTDNPAWIYYDLVTDSRYGIGEYITEDRIDKWELYTIAKYCDELIPDGYGSTEPRFTCNTYIQSQEEAFTTLSNLCSIFRGMQYWAGGYFSVSTDMPKDTVAAFTNSNVIDGVFNYSGSSLKTRHTAVKVIWNDPTDSFKQKVEYVEANGFVYDESNPNYAFKPISTYGVVQTEMVAIGCTSRGQANRAGRWLLYSELYETETITFKTGIENATLLPGTIIKTSDNFRQGKRLGGRVQAILSQSSMQLDVFEGELADGLYTLSFVVPYTDTNTKVNKSSIVSYYGTISTSGGKKVFNSSTGFFNTNIKENCIWVAAISGVLESELWRVISITQEDELNASITALEYHPGKFNAIENGMLLEERPVSQIDYGIPPTPTIDAQIFNSSGQLVYNTRGSVIDINYSSVYTTLSSNITNTTTTITCSSTDNFTSSGYLRIDNELIQYTGKTTTTFTGITRAVTGLIQPAVSHSTGTIIRQANKLSTGTGWVKEYLFFQTPNTIGIGSAMSWTGSSSTYEVKYKRVLSDSTSWVSTNTNVPYIEIKPLEKGLYDIEITAINTLGRRSVPLRRTVTLLGKSAPPMDVANFTVSKSTGGLVLKWDANNNTALQYPDIDLAGYEIREVYYTALPSSMVEYNDTVIWNQSITETTKTAIWNAATKAESGLITGTTYTDISASANKYNVYLIKAIDDSGNYSTTPSLIGTKVRPPQIITVASIVLDGTDLVIRWDPPISDVGISYYIVTYNNGSTITTRCNSTEFRKKLWFIGFEIFDIVAYDISGNASPTYSIEITVGTLPAPVLSNPSIIGENYVLSWTTPNTAGCAPIDYYELRLDQNWGLENSNLIAKVYGSTFTSKINWGGTKVIYIAAKDTAGTYGTSTSKSITTPTPGEVSKLEPTVIDNNVLLSWTIPSTGVELPIIEYEVRKSTPSGTWDSATSIGTKSGLFTTNFETVSGTYKYWVAAINSAGVVGTPRGVAVVVNQPPDYVLATNYFSDFTTKLGTNGSITTSNTHVGIDGKLLVPVVGNQTWATHFTDNAFDQISDFGNNTYLYPGAPTGYYQEIMDLGTIISGSTVSIALSTDILNGSPSILYEVSASQDNITYTAVKSTLVNYFTQFRYIKLKIIITNGIVRFNSLNVRIDIKQKTDSGNKNCIYSDSGGSIVYMTNDRTSTGTKIFKDILAINLTPSTGCTNSAGTVISTVTAIYDFVDVPDPLSFKILLLNSTNGERLSGSCSYTIRGI